ncbi:DUF134 domain-containing protein [Mailhella sp.]|uniref:DUF134 domain-containing protein n=1 Tax=Mailhella sp. TaxID=1981029 RepID=UPI00406409A7
MPRPKHCRYVSAAPCVDLFKPRGVPLRDLEEALLSVDELEALRLADMEGLTAIEAARVMRVSRHTFGRTLASARRIVATALSRGMALRIGGGSWALHGPHGHCCEGAPAFGADDGPHGPQCRCPRCSGLAAGAEAPAPSASTSIQYHSANPAPSGTALPVENAAQGRPSLSEPKEHTMQKIAISAEGPTLEDWVDPRFGRAGGFVTVELPERKLDYIDNGASQIMAMGAGIETAERMAAAGVQVVLSGYVGPKAFDALRAAGILICQDVEGITIGEAIENFVAGKYPFAEASNK